MLERAPELFVLVLAAAAVTCSPLGLQDIFNDGHAAQVPLKGLDVSPGWYDPRVNGGRMLDVRAPSRAENTIVEQWD